MTRLILLDRDGVINHDSLNYIKSEDEFVFIPKSIEAIVRLTSLGYTIGIATNQSGVSRGLYTEKDLAVIHAKLIQAVEAAGGRIGAIEYCIHLPQLHCQCRKPKPGMLYALSKQFNCSLEGVPFVGDRISDIEVALTVGASPVLIMSSMTDVEDLKKYPEVPVFYSLAQYVDTLES